ncbi:MAG: hypothetical protein GY861_10900 [bacterium]|nr:hypothetical protein [bacterium]
MAKQIYYTMIGSRSTPEDVMGLMTKFATKACEFGYIGRSGGADGADSCLEGGVENYLRSCEESCPEHYMEIYLPWKDFNGRDSLAGGYYTIPWMDNHKEAENIASEVHPKWKLDKLVESGEVEKPRNWKPMKQGAKKLHTRNVYQLLGQDLKTPSRFVICWAPPQGTEGHVKGGTGTAVKLGIDHGVEIINLHHEDQRKRVEDWVNK